MKNVFDKNRKGLEFALELLLSFDKKTPDLSHFPDILPDKGQGEEATLDQLSPFLLDGAEDLSVPTAFAHMDPPTPWITWAVSQWVASKNQNLLHPATAPFARDIEKYVVDWLSPFFGMNGGHMVPGSSLANLTALWAAREVKGVQKVYSSNQAHLSVEKAAHILGLEHQKLSYDGSNFPDDIDGQAFVITAGSTSSGQIEPLKAIPECGWLHVDAAWAGALRLSDKYSSLLDGITKADSICISAHKWFYQPKESAMIFFKDTEAAHKAISFGGAYLAVPNIGLQGSHGAMAAPLMATLMAYGREGLSSMMEKNMADAENFAVFIQTCPELELFAEPETGIVVWRAMEQKLDDRFMDILPKGSYSRTTLKNKSWFRNVAANPNLDVSGLIELIKKELEKNL